MTEGWHLWEIFIYKFYQTFPNGSGFFCKLLNPILYENINSTNSDGDILCQIYFFERVQTQEKKYPKFQHHGVVGKLVSSKRV